jgi:Piwi domain
VQAVQKVLNLARSAGRKSPPKHVIIYRNECSDGWLSFILSYEVPMIKSVLAKAGCKDAKLTLIVASRLQSVRFFKDRVCSLTAQSVYRSLTAFLPLDRSECQAS